MQGQPLDSRPGFEGFEGFEDLHRPLPLGDAWRSIPIKIITMESCTSIYHARSLIKHACTPCDSDSRCSFISDLFHFFVSDRCVGSCKHVNQPLEPATPIRPSSVELLNRAQIIVASSSHFRDTAKQPFLQSSGSLLCQSRCLRRPFLAGAETSFVTAIHPHHRLHRAYHVSRGGRRRPGQPQLHRP